MGSCSSRHRRRSRSRCRPPEGYHNLRQNRRPGEPTSFDRDDDDNNDGDRRPPTFSDAPDSSSPLSWPLPPGSTSVPEAKPVYKKPDSYPPPPPPPTEPVIGYPVPNAPMVPQYPAPAPPPPPTQPAASSAGSYYPPVPSSSYAERAIKPYSGRTSKKPPSSV